MLGDLLATGVVLARVADVGQRRAGPRRRPASVPTTTRRRRWWSRHRRRSRWSASAGNPARRGPARHWPRGQSSRRAVAIRAAQWPASGNGHGRPAAIATARVCHDRARGAIDVAARTGGARAAACWPCCTSIIHLHHRFHGPPFDYAGLALAAAVELDRRCRDRGAGADRGRGAGRATRARHHLGGARGLRGRRRRGRGRLAGSGCSAGRGCSPPRGPCCACGCGQLKRGEDGVRALSGASRSSSRPRRSPASTGSAPTIFLAVNTGLGPASGRWESGSARIRRALGDRRRRRPRAGHRGRPGGCCRGSAAIGGCAGGWDPAPAPPSGPDDA